LLKKIETVKLQNCAISEITLAELVFEAENSSNPQMNNELIVQFTEHLNILPLLNAIDFYAKEKVRLRKEGLMISDFDLLIGATAVANNLIMVTENTKEFQRISSLKIENWIKR
jgi:tRNA(fMet)-specific endonuclease VapC